MLYEPKIIGSVVKPIVVLVDDNHDYLLSAKELIEQMLRRTVLIADSPAKARTIINEITGPAVLLVDYHLPVTKGTKLVEELRSHALFPTEYLIVTGESKECVQIEITRVGAQPFSKIQPIGGSEYHLGDYYLEVILAAEKRLLDKVASDTDTISRAYTRQGGLKAWAQTWNHAKRHNKDTAIVYVDLDKFKVLNDRFGHDIGDKTLTAVEACMRQHKRTVDFIIRHGDEFIIILPETNVEGATEFALRLKKYISRILVEVSPGLQITVRASCGVGVLSAKDLSQGECAFSKDFDFLVHLAEVEMYKDKHGSKTQSPDLDMHTGAEEEKTEEQLQLRNWQILIRRIKFILKDFVSDTKKQFK